MATTEVKVPDIGDFKDVAVIELLVKPGDTIKPEQSLVTVESDKASMEIPSSHAGVVKELKVKVGDRVAEGSVLLTLEAAQGAAAPRGPREQLHPLPLPPRRERAGVRVHPRPPTPTPAPSTSNATCSSSARVPAATPPPSAPPTSA
jgi:pyruvate/2-oxoglutarate dehydrogenase complex dihydrolipoamide acyltransferase (E2) component